jgi:hypothetical protein
MTYLKYQLGISKNYSGKAFRPANTGVPQSGMRMLAGRNNAASGVFRGALNIVHYLGTKDTAEMKGP